MESLTVESWAGGLKACLGHLRWLFSVAHLALTVQGRSMARPTQRVGLAPREQA